MPSQQLPKSSKVDTLPPDLKSIAEGLIRKKLGITPEPEIVERKPPPSEAKKSSRASQRPTEGRVVEVEFYSQYNPYRERVVLDISIDPDRAYQMVKSRLADLMRRHGCPFEFRTNDRYSTDYLGYSDYGMRYDW